MTRYQVLREERSTNLTTLVNQSIEMLVSFAAQRGNQINIFHGLVDKNEI